jgi:uncharacterized protein (TIGR00266 family)
MSNPIDFEIQHAPAYAALKLRLRPDQTVLVESGALAAMDSCIQMKSKMQGGLMKSLGRMLGGESLFMSEFTAKQRSGELLIAPGVPGDVKHYPLNGNALMVQSSGFVACSPTVTLDTKFQGMKGFFSGESMFLVRASGTGDLWFSSYGAVLEIPIDGDYVVDTGYVVAFEETLSYQVEMMGGLSFKGLRTGLLGGEGLVCRFRGRGRLWIQSRQLYSLLNFLYAFRPVKSNS